ncbi:heparin lyase I family protein [Pedobacter sp. SD-b]|uniref:Heparin lyase I family protein n=1 Tax=Pedobacter segetis TaxID=2793069 RepID=A0ABS1BL30_9SPHI|nr:heparin lyase I family protein [Pedobacter segetis]MBK0383597.1 heparin lyase I family protein [Pedobacter segetis]
MQKVNFLIFLTCFFCACIIKKTTVSTEAVFTDTSQIAGKLIWYGNPDKPYKDVFVNFNDEDNHGTTPTLTTINDPKYGKVWKVYKPSGAKRAEISRAKGYEQHDGETIYISYNWKIKVKQKKFKTGCAVFQWKTEGGGDVRQNYPFNLTYGNGVLSLNAYGPGTSTDWWKNPGKNIATKKNTIWKKAVPQNQWQNIVFGIKVSSYTGTDTTKLGYIEFWFNGVKQTFNVDNSGIDYRVILSPDKKRAYHRTLDGNITYPKWGAYGGSSIPYDITAYVSDLKIRRK